MSLARYIVDRSQPIPYIGCWLWLKSFGSHGYGNATVAGKAMGAHRASYRAFNGPIPEGMLIQHCCDNKWCVNPDHLSTGTDRTNAIDKVLKGRAARGIPFEDRTKIRARYLAGGITQRALAAEYGVTQRAIWQAIRRPGPTEVRSIDPE